MTATDEDAPPSAPAARTADWLVADTLVENLQLIADGIVAVAGFAVAAIRMRQGDELVLVVDTARPAGIGTCITVRMMLDELEFAEDWGVLQFVPQERGTSRSGGPRLDRASHGRQRRTECVAPDGHARCSAVRRARRAARSPRDRRATRRVAARTGASTGARTLRGTGQSRRALRGGARVLRRAGRHGEHGEGDRAHHQRPAQLRRLARRERGAPSSRVSVPTGCGSRPSSRTTAGVGCTRRRRWASSCRRRSSSSPRGLRSTAGTISWW